MKLKNRISKVEPLVKGQLWKMNDIHIEIMEVGKTLTHYRLYQNQKRVPISLGGIGTVQDYLKKNKAILIKKEAILIKTEPVLVKKKAVLAKKA